MLVTRGMGRKGGNTTSSLAIGGFGVLITAVINAPGMLKLKEFDTQIILRDI